MSLFGNTPPDESPSMHSSFARSRQSLFDEEDAGATPSNSNSLFQDDFASGGGASAGGSPWDMPTPRKHQSRAELLRTLLPASDAPDSYIETFDSVVREDGSAGKVSPGGLMRVLAAAKLDADAQAKIMNIIAPGGSGEEVVLGRNEFNVFLGLIGLAQEGETVSLDGVDERRRSKFLGLFLTCFPSNDRLRQPPHSCSVRVCSAGPNTLCLLHMPCFICRLSATAKVRRVDAVVSWRTTGDWLLDFLPH